MERLDFFLEVVVALRPPPIPLVPVGGLDGRVLMENIAEEGFECFVDADEATIAEVLREAESYLSAQLTAGIAADQRALSFISLLAASTAAIAAGGGALLIGDGASIAVQVVAWTLFGTAAGLLVSMWYAIRSAMPAEFEFVGNTPYGWIADVRAKRPLKMSLAQQLAHYAGMIESNDLTLKSNARQMKKSVWWAWGSLVVGGAISIVALIEKSFGLAGALLPWIIAGFERLT